jgi:predicted enzyme related to lactoylglutathione lyase
MRYLTSTWFHICVGLSQAAPDRAAVVFQVTENKDIMGILEFAKPVIVVCTRDRARAINFYRDSLGLTLRQEDALAAVFTAGETTIRISAVPDFTPHEHTILGFLVSDVDTVVKNLTGNGVAFLRLPGFPHDQLGILSLPGGRGRVAWLKDPDGNILSVTDVE